MRIFLRAVGKSLLCATGIFFLMFFLFSVVFVSNLGPIAAFIVAANSFLVSLLVFLPVVTMRELRAKRMQHAAALTHSERQLLKSARTSHRVAVIDPRSSPAFTESLIRDLQATGLFFEVREYGENETVDVVATIKRTYLQREEGQNFVLHRPERQSEGLEIDVYYNLGGRMRWNGRKSDRRQYLERLSVELVKASQTLFGQSKATSTASTSDS